jgi:general stress protein YciG
MRVLKRSLFYFSGGWELLTKKGNNSMAGTKMGGQKAAATNKAKYGKDFYARIGQMGGKLGRTGGFYANRELARKAGREGGRISRRGPAKV